MYVIYGHLEKITCGYFLSVCTRCHRGLSHDTAKKVNKKGVILNWFTTFFLHTSLANELHGEYVLSTVDIIWKKIDTKDRLHFSKVASKTAHAERVIYIII